MATARFREQGSRPARGRPFQLARRLASCPIPVASLPDDHMEANEHGQCTCRSGWSPGLVALTAGLTAMPARAATSEPPLAPTPRVQCGAGSIPEPGMQGRVPKDQIAARNLKNGYRCNVEVLGHQGIGGGFP